MRLVEDVIYKLPVFEKYNSCYYKLTDLLNSLESVNRESIEICNCTLNPYYLDNQGTYDFYWQDLKLKLVNEATFESYIYRLFGKHSNEISPDMLKLHSTCYQESILPCREIKIASIISWANYVINENTNDLELRNMAKKHFNDEKMDIGKFHFDYLDSVI